MFDANEELQQVYDAGPVDMPPEPAAMPRKLNLTVPLDERQREALARRVCDAIGNYYSATEERRENIAQWRRDAAVMPSGGDGPWADSADVPGFLTAVFCRGHTTRLNQQIVHAEPPVTAVARKPEVVADIPQFEDALGARIDEAKWKIHASEGNIELPVVGDFFLRLTYETEKVRYPHMGLSVEPEDFQALAEAGVDEVDAFHDAVETDSRGAPKFRLQWSEKVKHAGAQFKIIPWEDGVILPATVRDWRDARGIGERMMVSGLDLRRGSKQKKYYREAVDKLLERERDPIPDDRQERLDEQGISSDGADWLFGEGENDDEEKLYRDYECHELAYRFDANGDGEEEWCIVTVHTHSNTLLRCQYLPYEHGNPHYRKMHLGKRPGELWGVATAELVACYQDAVTAVLNQIINAADLAIAAKGNFFYDASAGFDPGKHVHKLGTPIKVDDVRGIQPVPVSQVPAEHYQLIQTLKDHAELIAGTSNPSLGKATDTQKTLGEVQLVMQAANLQFEEMAAGVALQWAEVFDDFRLLEAQYGEQGMVPYRKTAAPGAVFQPTEGDYVTPDGRMAFRSIPAEILRADVDLVPTGLSALSDLQSRISQATLVRQAVLQDPVAAMQVQSGMNEIAFILLDYYLQEMRCPIREKILETLRKGEAERQAAMMQAQAMENQAAGLMLDAMAGGAPPEAPPMEEPLPGGAGLAGAAGETPPLPVGEEMLAGVG